MTAYEMRISDWSSDVCSSDLRLLRDEPLASLDMARKQEILPYLERLHDELDIPVLYVSHAPQEVARLADHLVLLEEGRATASGPIGQMLSRLDLPLAMDDAARSEARRVRERVGPDL